MTAYENLPTPLPRDLGWWAAWLASDDGKRFTDECAEEASRRLLRLADKLNGMTCDESASDERHVTDNELMTELRKRAEKSLYAAGCFKGLPADKHYEELNVAGIVLEYLGRVVSVESEPHGPDTAPDVGIVLQSGERIGLEVTELVDGVLRGRHARRRGVEQTQGLSQKDVFDAIIQTGVDPVQADSTIPAFSAYRAWDVKEIAAQLDVLVERKDANTHLRDHASDYDSIWLAVFIGEQHINDFPDLVQEAVAHLTYHPTLISRVFVVLDYVPGRDDSGYPVVEISSAYI